MSYELIEACRSGSRSVVKTLLVEGADVNQTNSFGYTPLHLAAANGHAAIVDLLIAKGADVNAKTEYGSTPLHWAAFYGHAAIVELLVANGTDMNARNKFGGTPLHHAAINGHADVVELLIANRADVNFKNDDGETPIDTANNRGYATIANLLRSKQINCVTGHASSERHYAIISLLNEDDSLRKRLGILSDFQPKPDFDLDRLLKFAIAKHRAADPSLAQDVEAGIAFHMEAAQALEQQGLHR